jgi:hypothetical protein
MGALSETFKAMSVVNYEVYVFLNRFENAVSLYKKILPPPTVFLTHRQFLSLFVATDFRASLECQLQLKLQVPSITQNSSSFLNVFAFHTGNKL